MTAGAFGVTAGAVRNAPFPRHSEARPPPPSFRGAPSPSCHSEERTTRNLRCWLTARTVVVMDRPSDADFRFLTAVRNDREERPSPLSFRGTPPPLSFRGTPPPLSFRGTPPPLSFRGAHDEESKMPAHIKAPRSNGTGHQMQILDSSLRFGMTVRGRSE